MRFRIIFKYRMNQYRLKTLKMMSRCCWLRWNGQSKNADNIKAEQLQYGGEVTVKVLHKLCNAILKTKEWPSQWTECVDDKFQTRQTVESVQITGRLG